MGELGGLNLYLYELNNALLLRPVSEDPLVDKKKNERPSEVTGTPVPVGPGLNSIVCKGGKLEIQIGNKTASDKCTPDHEQVHINDWKKRYGDNLCSGVPDGQLPCGGKDYKDFMRQTECDAYKAGKACREKLLKDCVTEEEKKKLEDKIKIDDQRIELNCKK